MVETSHRIQLEGHLDRLRILVDLDWQSDDFTFTARFPTIILDETLDRVVHSEHAARHRGCKLVKNVRIRGIIEGVQCHLAHCFMFVHIFGGNGENQLTVHGFFGGATVSLDHGDVLGVVGF